MRSCAKKLQEKKRLRKTKSFYSNGNRGIERKDYFSGVSLSTHQLSSSGRSPPSLAWVVGKQGTPH